MSIKDERGAAINVIIVYRKYSEDYYFDCNQEAMPQVGVYCV